MSEYAWAMLVYFLLQAASLALLPRWWKLAAVPALLLAPMIVSEWLQPSYMSDVLTAMMAIFTCGYLVLVWVVFGITKLVQRAYERRVATGPSKTKGDGVVL
jgi:hypothetical protein